MAETDIVYTPEQREAICNRGGALLVSAAAGSGKTRVLVERLLSRVTGENERCDIDDFLVITYTRAAAAELRGKIRGEIARRLARDPTNRHLRRQSALCHRAQISTIHGFCTEVLRENAGQAGITPDFRVADEGECTLIRESVLEDVLNERYERIDEIPEFSLLVDTMSAGRDDSKLVRLVLDAHGKLQSHADPGKWIDGQLEMLDLSGTHDAGETVWGRLVMARAQKTALYWLEEMRRTYEKMRAFPDFLKAYGDSFLASIDGISSFARALSEDWDTAAELSDVAFPTARISGYEAFKAVRTKCKKAMESLRDTFSCRSSELIEDMEAVRPAVSELLRLVRDFDAAYGKEKRRRGLVDFSDQEHLTVRLLLDGEGAPTPLAREISRRFEEIMVDEYQDVNEVQDLIFQAVSKDAKNIFMVGDVKQSIYRFRLADPSIFLRKYLRYPDIGAAAEDEARRVILPDNFRSRAGILQAVNFLFKNIMSTDCGEMDYTKREYLKAGAAFPPSGEPSVELAVISAHRSEETDDEENLAKTDLEARCVARRIEELVTGGFAVSDGQGEMRPACYGDIVILLRSPKNKAERYAAALMERCIPVSLNQSENFYETVEISVTISLLSVIDNPLQDIPLISVLRSSVYGFTPDELAAIRSCDRTRDFYLALVTAAETDEKCRAFLSELDGYRRLAPELSSDRLIWHIYGKTGMLAVMGAMKNGPERRDNLMTLYETARRFEANGYRGLFSFITYLTRLMERGEEPAERSRAAAGNCVQIMSVHKSKGLEFPVVFLADTAKRLNFADARSPLLIHPALGVGAKRLDLSRRIEYPTLARLAVGDKIVGETLSEEMRILYVAMTRAREKLILLASYTDAEKELKKLLPDDPGPIAPEVLLHTKSAADWIVMAALRRRESDALRFGAESAVVRDEGEPWLVRLIGASEIVRPRNRCDLPGEEPVSASEEDIRALAAKFSFVYPHQAAVNLPSKLTATELKGRFSDIEAAEEADATVADIEQRRTQNMRRPDFITRRKGLSPAEKGTALHLVMQYIDYEKCTGEDSIRREIGELVRRDMITPEQGRAVDPRKIDAFFRSELGRRVLTADRVYRELKFSLLVPAGTVVPEGGDDEILFQGVIDCCIEEEGVLTIIDFKTDLVNETTVSERANLYLPQIMSYARAMERMTKKPVESRILYFFALDRAVSVAG